MPHKTTKRICMVTYSVFSFDARVMRYAQALGCRGDHVDVLALRQPHESRSTIHAANINLVLLQRRHAQSVTSPLAYLFPVLRFLFRSSFWIARRHARRPYDLLHIHNVPDFLVFAAWYPKLTGTKVILDIHDLLPEFYSSKFSAPECSGLTQMLKWCERLAVRFSDHVILSNHLWRDKYALRTGASAKCSVFINHVDVSIFRACPRTRHDSRLVVLFPGGLQWHQGVDIAIRAFRKVSEQLPHAQLHIYGDGLMKRYLLALTKQLGLEKIVCFFDPVPVPQVPQIMVNADLGVVPKRADSFGNEAYSTKVMEFFALGVPVVVSNTKIDRFYFDNSGVKFFEPENELALAQAIIDLLRDPGLRRELACKGQAYAARNNWDNKREEYLKLVDTLIGNNDVNNLP